MRLPKSLAKRSLRDMEMPTIKSFTVFVATSKGTQVFRSVEEIPSGVRETLARQTNGMQSATIVIADHNGREELSRALQGLPSRVESRVVEAARRRGSRPEDQVQESHGRVWIDAGIAAALALLAGLTAYWR